MTFDSADSIRLSTLIHLQEQRAEQDPNTITANKVYEMKTEAEVLEAQEALLAIPSPRGAVAVNALTACRRKLDGFKPKVFEAKIEKLGLKAAYVGIESKAIAQQIIDGELTLPDGGFWGTGIMEATPILAQEYVDKCNALGLDELGAYQ